MYLSSITKLLLNSPLFPRYILIVNVLNVSGIKVAFYSIWIHRVTTGLMFVRRFPET